MLTTTLALETADVECAPAAVAAAAGNLKLNVCATFALAPVRTGELEPRKANTIHFEILQ
jgi:hypothetical protein